ncbi:hypothetical protein [Streptomyces sp. NPDC047990]|uniref:hypothetical protein n=1 Tax=Streptomyces sp. NPDC047990 TaxID=3365496 RepID=UPI00372338CC
MQDGITREWIPTRDVRVGDKIACLLSDASADLEVTGWSDKFLDLSRYALRSVTHRTFKVSWEPWWAWDMKTYDLGNKALVLSRRWVHYGYSLTACGDLRTHDTSTTRISDVTCPDCNTAVRAAV